MRSSGQKSSREKRKSPVAQKPRQANSRLPSLRPPAVANSSRLLGQNRNQDKRGGGRERLVLKVHLTLHLRTVLRTPVLRDRLHVLMRHRLALEALLGHAVLARGLVRHGRRVQLRERSLLVRHGLAHSGRGLVRVQEGSCSFTTFVRRSFTLCSSDFTFSSAAFTSPARSSCACFAVASFALSESTSACSICLSFSSFFVTSTPIWSFSCFTPLTSFSTSAALALALATPAVADSVSLRASASKFWSMSNCSLSRRASPPGLVTAAAATTASTKCCIFRTAIPDP